jgi:tetratricopeptide (TPR) repeat protein
LKPEPRKAKKASDRRSPNAPPTFSAAQVWHHALPLLGIIAFTWLAYSNSFSAPFLLDNDPIILKDDRVHAITSEHLHRIWTQLYWIANLEKLYRPLTTLSFLFNWAVLGNAADPSGYHAVNFLLHALNIVLVYLLGLALLENRLPALAAAAIWAVHPVLIESVTNIVGRADLLAAFGVLAALLAHRQALRASGTRKPIWIGAVFLAVAVGIFSKESGLVALPALLLYDLAFDRDVSWKSRIPSYVALAVPVAVFLVLRTNVLANSVYAPVPFTDNPLTGQSFWTARLTAIKIIGRYFLLLVWPATLSWDYSYQEIPPAGAGAILALLVCIAAAVLALRSWRREPALFFAIAFFFAALLPTANLFLMIGTIMAERLLYLAAVGFFLAIVAAVWKRLPAAQRNNAAIALSAILLALAVRTWSRNSVWADAQQFWRSGVETAPGSYRTNLAAATHNVAPDRAAAVDRALAILDPLPDLENSGSAWRQAGTVYRELGLLPKSLQSLLRSERIEQAQDALITRENAQRLRSGLTFVPASLYLELGRTYMRLSDSRHAIAAFERGRALEPDPDVLEELASAYRAQGDLRGAAQALVEALAMDSSRGALMSKLVELYGAIDPQGCAISREGGSAGLNIDCPLVHGDLCAASRNVVAAYRRHGQEYEAASIRRTAIDDLHCAADQLN